MDNTNSTVPLQYALTKTTSAFADGATSVIVKDSDISDVSLTLTEIPLPPEANKPPNPPDPDL